MSFRRIQAIKLPSLIKNIEWKSVLGRNPRRFILPGAGILIFLFIVFFVFFPISVVWLDAERRVVDKVLAHPWRPYYAPSRPARYFVEGHPSLLDKVSVGDELDFAGGAV